MCEALERLMDDVIEEQVNQKIEEARIENIRKIIKAFNVSAEQAMDILQIPQNRRAFILSYLQYYQIAVLKNEIKHRQIPVLIFFSI